MLHDLGHYGNGLIENLMHQVALIYDDKVHEEKERHSHLHDEV